MNGVLDIHCHIGVDLLFYLRGNYPYSRDVPNLLSDGARLGVTHQVVFPMVSNLSLSIPEMKEGRIVGGNGLETTPYAFENRRMMKEIGMVEESAGRLLPFWMFDPSRECAAQVIALKELREQYSCYGLKVQATILQSPISGLLDVGRGILELAQEWDVPVLIHTAVHPNDPWSQNRDILRVVESAPGVRFILAHSCRFDRPSLDRVAELENAWFDCSAHRIACRLAVQGHPAIAGGETRFPSDYQNPAKVLADLAEAYPTKFCWGSDSPFESYMDASISLRSCYEEEVADLMALDLIVRKRVSWENSLNVLRCGLEEEA